VIGTVTVAKARMAVVTVLAANPGEEAVSVTVTA
jgi:hypothetical protein